jgi:hypothetical protein
VREKTWRELFLLVARRLEDCANDISGAENYSHVCRHSFMVVASTK